MKLMISGLIALSGMMFAQTNALTLTQAIDEAMTKNLDLAANRFNISIAEAAQITAALRPNPVLTVQADHLDLLGTRYNNINNGGPNEFAMRTDFILERAGKRSARMALASTYKSVVESGFEDSIRRLIFDVQSAFVDVQLAKENLALANENLTNLNGIVNVNQARAKSGDLAIVEFNRSQVAALQFQTAVKQAELQLRQAKIRLQLLLGRSVPAADLDVAGEMRRDAQPILLAQVREQALRLRPDLVGLQQTQIRNQADLRLQLAQGRVDYTLGTEYRRQQAPSGTGNSLGFFFSAPLPVFNRNQGEVARAQREIDQSGAQIRALQARVENEIASAWDQYTTSRSLLEDIEKNMLTKAREVRQTTEYSYRRGEATLVEFLDAQRAFNDMMESYNESRAGYARSLYLIDAVAAVRP